MQIKIFDTKKGWISETIKFIISLNPKSIALGGGNTPRPIYKALAKKLITSKIPKQKIIFFQVDERYVPATHPKSNQRMIRETLIKKTGFPFHYFDTSIPIKKSLEKYSKKLPKTFDLMILGIGPDGHIASLFPNSKALTTKKTVAHTTTANFNIKNRLTLTFPPILKSKNILVLLTGKEKLNIIKKLKNSKITSTQIKKFPALRLLQHKNLAIYSCKI